MFVILTVEKDDLTCRLAISVGTITGVAESFDEDDKSQTTIMMGSPEKTRETITVKESFDEVGRLIQSAIAGVGSRSPLLTVDADELALLKRLAEFADYTPKPEDDTEKLLTEAMDRLKAIRESLPEFITRPAKQEAGDEDEPTSNP